MAARTGRSSPCVFCALVAGEGPAAVVLNDDGFLGFLDRRPLFVGHTLLVPKVHHETLTDLPPDLVGPLFARARLLAGVMETELGSEGSFVAINNRVSQSVAHLHVHVVPRTKGDGLRGFFWPRTTYADDEEMAAIATRIRAALEREPADG
ncbi:MAG TPA: HIT family protein [Iamia sp.]|nr:HIT family protein [Iamia sp.]HXH56038.1 HIT family protein [Iamia sp.]